MRATGAGRCAIYRRLGRLRLIHRFTRADAQAFMLSLATRALKLMLSRLFLVRIILFTLLSVLLGLLACSDRGSPLSAFSAREVVVGGKAYGYRVYAPKNRDPNTKLPVMLFLHGSGARGDDNIAQVDVIAWALEPVKEKINFIVVVPQCRENTFWAAKDMADYSLAALDAAVNEFNGDTNRLYLAGFSLGGYGVWQIAAANPGKFAALVPVAGGVVGERPIEPPDRAAIIPSVGTMLDSPEPYQAVAKAIGQTSVWVFHGAKDDAVPVAFAQRIVQALKETGSTNVRYTEYPDDGHQIFGKAIVEPGLLEWLEAQRLP
ncbi:MAG TPA: prolyl oligopeptidase family serine peptidase [Pyrinomonadaceae bacterium]